MVTPILNTIMQFAIAIFWQVTIVLWKTAKKLQTANFPKDISYLTHPPSLFNANLQIAIFWQVTIVFWQTAKKLQTANFP